MSGSIGAPEKQDVDPDGIVHVTDVLASDANVGPRWSVIVKPPDGAGTSRLTRSPDAAQFPGQTLATDVEVRPPDCPDTRR